MFTKVKKLVCFALSSLLFGSGFLSMKSMCLSANADENYASTKGFKVDNYLYSGDLSIEDVEVSYDGTAYGYMSLWVGQYKYYNSHSSTMYVTLLVEARLSSRGQSGKDYYNNQSMQIIVSHDEYLTSDVIYYDPVQMDSQYTVNQQISAEGNSEDIKLGYTYQTSHVYNDINYTTTTYKLYNNDLS